jgi:hypothetical protein
MTERDLQITPYLRKRIDDHSAAIAREFEADAAEVKRKIEALLMVHATNVQITAAIARVRDGYRALREGR